MTALLPVDLLRSDPPSATPVVALSEGTDPRVVEGGLAAHAQGLANIIFVGETDEVLAQLHAAGGEIGPGISIHDPQSSDLHGAFAQEFHTLRQHKGVDLDRASTMVKDPLVYAAMLVRLGHATGTVGGAVATTSDVVRAAIQVIGLAPETRMISSFFLMYPPEGSDAAAMLYADCGLVIDPSAEELVDITSASARSCAALLRADPAIAMLSFSTKGSAAHPKVSKMAKAAELARAALPELQIDGELQFDAAIVPDVAARKAPGSPVAGAANVMIFPDLDAGNIAYKITQRLGGYSAIGPVLQGLAKPANDLSRGCSATDVTQMIAVTVLQSGGTKS